MTTEPDYIKALRAQVQRAESDLAAAKKALHVALLDACPIKAGDVVIRDRDGVRFCVSRVDQTYTFAVPVLYGYPQNKGGEWSRREQWLSDGPFTKEDAERVAA